MFTIESRGQPRHKSTTNSPSIVTASDAPVSSLAANVSATRSNPGAQVPSMCVV
jgi:hypothetical protein